MPTVNTETAKVEWTDLITLSEDGEDPTGYVNDLMEVARYHISKAYEANEITQAEVGQAYVAMIPAAFQTGLEFVLRKDLTEAQANEQLTDTDRKTAWSNKDLEVKDVEIALKETQNSEAIANGEKDRLIKDEQMVKLQEEVDLLETQDEEMKLNGIKDRAIKDEQIVKLQEEVDLLETQDEEIKLNGVIDRLIKDEQKLNEEDKRLSTASAREEQSAQKDLYTRQKDGYDDEANHKVFKTSMDAWALTYSSGALPREPNIIANDEISKLYEIISPTDYVAP